MSLLVEMGSKVLFASSEHGIWPLVRCVAAHRAQIAGATAFDRVVGRAAARLFAHAQVARVYTPVASQPAVDALSGAGTRLFPERIVPNIMALGLADLCEMERLSQQFDTAESLFQHLLSLLPPLGSNGESAPRQT
ncbi:MAG: DUF1893 domain-containing protein [Chloroflexi bacterium]|nr:DUF1893 domain-containing protein [Chloroflexota bacterium]